MQSQLAERMTEPSDLKGQIRSSISFSNHIDCDHFTVRLGNGQRSRTVHELKDVAAMATNAISVDSKHNTKLPNVEAFAELHALVHTDAHVKLLLNHYQYLVLLRLKEMLTELQEELALDTQEIIGTQLESMSCCIGVLLTSAEIALLLQPTPTSSYEAKSTDSDSSSLIDSDLSPSGSREALATEEKGLTDETCPVKLAAGSPKSLEGSGAENLEASLVPAAEGDFVPLHSNGAVMNTHIAHPTVSDTENLLDGGSVEEACEAEESLHSETAVVNETATVCDKHKCPASPSRNSLSLKSRSTSFTGSAELIPLKNFEVELTSALNLTRDVTKEALNVTVDFTKEAVSITKDAFTVSRDMMASTMQRMMSLPPSRDLASKREENAVISTTTGSSKLRTVMINRTASQQSFDSTSLDGSLLDDRLSVDSDGSENFVILTDTESGVESDLLSHPLEDSGSRLRILDVDGKTSPDVTSSASHSIEESTQEMTSVLVLKMLDVNCGIDVRGDDLAVMVQALEVVSDQLVNVMLQQYLDRRSTIDDLGFQKPVSEVTGTHPQMCLRLESGPAAAVHSPLAVRNGFLHFQINSYSTELFLSTLNNIVPFLEDEFIPEVIPMKIEIVDTQITLKDDGPRVYPTSPGPVPVTFSVDHLTMLRTDDGTFCIKVAQVDHPSSVTNQQNQSSLSTELGDTNSESPQDGTTGKNKDAAQEDQYEQLKKELKSTRMALAKATMENERLLCEVKKHNPEFHL